MHNGKTYVAEVIFSLYPSLKKSPCLSSYFPNFFPYHFIHLTKLTSMPYKPKFHKYHRWIFNTTDKQANFS